MGFFTNDAEDAGQQMLDRGQRYQFIGANPYQQGWDSLIGQLQAQSQGMGPSLADSQYRAAHQDALASQLALSRGRGPGAARQGMMNMGRMGQGLAQGAAQARLQEQLAAQQALAGAMSSAGQADFQRAYANQNAYTGVMNNMIAQPTGFESAMGMAAQGAGAYAMMKPPTPRR